MTKKCNYCEQEFPATSEFFNKRKQSKDGFEYACKSCRKLRNRLEKDGKPFISAKTLKFEKERAQGFRTCSDCNTQKDFSEFERADGSTRAICNSCHAKRGRTHRKVNKANRPEYHSIRENLNGARKRAKEQGLDFNIEIEDLMPFPTHCEVSGLKLTYGDNNKISGASLDKIVPSKGYVKGNVKIISHMVNNAKSNLTLKQLKKLIQYIEKNL